MFVLLDVDGSFMGKLSIDVDGVISGSLASLCLILTSGGFILNLLIILLSDLDFILSLSLSDNILSMLSILP